MGRLMGAYDIDDDHDIPELNKCPDCQTYFEGDNCPICGKPCPENMKAGNRPAVKQKKRKRPSGDTGRVTFINWYHSWWFIILMMIIFPIVGIILLITSPHKKIVKIALVIVLILIIAVRYGGLIYYYFNRVFAKPPVYVNTKITETEYRQKCEEINAETLYRAADGYKDAYVRVTLTVTGREVDFSEEYYPTYYVCKTEDNENVVFLVRNCLIDVKNYIVGDKITVYGEFKGNQSLWTENSSFDYPCIYMAYADLVKE
ncbi:MAG: hypothetical protein II777_06755 [Clostridia bacterium]|nr:hypothetical protein [Clostridia bacterium]